MWRESLNPSIRAVCWCVHFIHSRGSASLQHSHALWRSELIHEKHVPKAMLFNHQRESTLLSGRAGNMKERMTSDANGLAIDEPGITRHQEALCKGTQPKDKDLIWRILESMDIHHEVFCSCTNCNWVCQFQGFCLSVCPFQEPPPPSNVISGQIRQF